MIKIVQYIQDICLDPTCSHEWMRTSIREYAIPKQQIIFNYYGEQLNIMDDAYCSSRFAKGRNKEDIEVPDEFVNQIVQFLQLKKSIIKTINSLSKQKTKKVTKNNIIKKTIKQKTSY